MTPSSSSSSVPAPGSRWRFVIRTSGIRLQPSARMWPPRPAPIRAALSRDDEEAGQHASLDDRLALGGDALVVEAEGAEPERRRRVGGDVHLLRAVAERPEVARLEEARPRVRRLGPVDPVELGRMADRLVHLQRHLLGVDHRVGDHRGARLGAQQRRRLLADARRLALEPEALDVLPAGACARAAVRARVAAELRQLVVRGDRVDPGAGLVELLLGLDAVGREQHLVLALRPHGCLGDDDVLVPKRCLGAEAEVDLVGERDVERVDRDRRAVAARARLDRRERAAAPDRRRERERGRAPGGRDRALGVEAPVAREAPGAAREHADADPLGLDVDDVLDAAVLRRDRLRAADHGARVRVLGSRRESRLDRRFAELTHRATLPRCV